MTANTSRYCDRLVIYWSDYAGGIPETRNLYLRSLFTISAVISVIALIVIVGITLRNSIPLVYTKSHIQTTHAIVEPKLYFPAVALCGPPSFTNITAEVLRCLWGNKEEDNQLNSCETEYSIEFSNNAKCWIFNNNQFKKIYYDPLPQELSNDTHSSKWYLAMYVKIENVDWGWHGLASFFFDQSLQEEWYQRTAATVTGCGTFNRVYISKSVDKSGKKEKYLFGSSFETAPLVGTDFGNYSLSEILFLEIRYIDGQTKTIELQQLYSWFKVMSEVGPTKIFFTFMFRNLFTSKVGIISKMQTSYRESRFREHELCLKIKETSTWYS